MRILYVHANNNELGGADYCLIKLASAMRRRGHMVTVLLRVATPVVQLYQANDVNVVLLPIWRPRRVDYSHAFPSYHKAITSMWLIANLVRRQKYDLVHANDFLDGFSIIAAKCLRVPAVHHIRMFVQHNDWRARALKRIFFLCATHTVCVSYAVKETMYKGLSESISVIYDWLDMESTGQSAPSLSLHAELNLPPETQIIGCVGRIEEWKGQHVFIAAAEAVAHAIAPTHFVIIGGSVPEKEIYLRHLQELIEDSTCRDHISFLGHRPDMRGILSQLTVMVHSSVLPEPFGQVVMEAMYCGAIVVAADAGGIREQIADGITGYLYEPGNPSDMAEKVLQALTTPERQSIKSSAKAFVNSQFGIDRSHEFEALYRRMLAP